MIKQKTKNMHDLTSWAARLTLKQHPSIIWNHTAFSGSRGAVDDIGQWRGTPFTLTTTGNLKKPVNLSAAVWKEARVTARSRTHNLLTEGHEH